MSQSSFRRDYLTKPIFRLAQHALPRLSDTEREAIEAGDVWWDAELFTGNPDWRKLLAFAPAKLSEEEQQFLSGPVEELCRMLDDWKINWQWHDLPPEVWDFLKSRKFFAMIIPKQYGGLGFSAYAHSEVIRKLSSCSICAAVTAMVPNSLGPGELLAAIRHQGAAGLLAAAARPRRGDSLLRSDQPGSRLRRRRDDRFRRGLPRHVRGPRDHRHQAQLAQALHHARADRDRAGTCFQASRSRSPDRQPRRHRHHARFGADESSRRQYRPASSAVHAGFPERAELGPRRLHPDRQRDRRRRSGRQGLENADERAGRRPRHFAAVVVGGGRGVFRQRHRRLCAHPRAVPRADRTNSRRSRSGSAASPPPLICSTPRAA